MKDSYPELGLLIGGEMRAGGGRASEPVVNPATEEVLGELSHASTADLDEALRLAADTFPAWSATPAVARSKILRRAAALLRERAEDIARVATMEQGKTIHETRIEVEMSAEIFEWYAEEGRRVYGRVLQSYAPGTRMWVRREPVGPVAGFAPWNFPLGNPARKIGASLGAGCTCILKGAEEAPASALAIARAVIDAGLPAGVLSVVFGNPPEISTHLLGSGIIRKMTFTGSTAVGKQLMKLAADKAVRTTMELGGHAPVLVMDDVDVDDVLDQCAMAKFRNAGQVCVSPTRFLVHKSIHERFVEGFAARAESWPLGDGLDEKNRMGPMIHPRRIAAMEGFVEDAVKCGAKLHTGGKRLANKGYFWAPTVLSDVPLKARIMNEEPFGPLAIVNPVTDLDEAVAEGNRLAYGLAAFGFSKAAKTTTLMAERLEAGMVGINTFRISVPESPFGGVKDSGHGSEEGIEGLDGFFVTKFVSEG